MKNRKKHEKTIGANMFGHGNENVVVLFRPCLGAKRGQTTPKQSKACHAIGNEGQWSHNIDVCIVFVCMANVLVNSAVLFGLEHLQIGPELRKPSDLNGRSLQVLIRNSPTTSSVRKGRTRSRLVSTSSQRKTGD